LHRIWPNSQSKYRTNTVYVYGSGLPYVDFTWPDRSAYCTCTFINGLTALQDALTNPFPSFTS
jgi:hypothetical protein